MARGSKSIYSDAIDQINLRNNVTSDYQKYKRALKRDYPNLTMKQKYEAYDINRIGYLDIEATNLKGNFGFLLSWVLMVRNTQSGTRKTKYAVINKHDIHKSRKERKNNKDKRILGSLLDELKSLDMLVAHYGIGWGKMDMPFVRTRTLYNFGKTDFLPKHKHLRYADTWKMAHQLFSLHSYRLDVVAEACGIKTKKTPVTGHDWQLAQDGDHKSLKYVLHHNINDVKILADVHEFMEELVPIPATYV